MSNFAMNLFIGVEVFYARDSLTLRELDLELYVVWLPTSGFVLSIVFM